MGNTCGDCLPQENDQLLASMASSDPKYHHKLVQKRRTIMDKGGNLWAVTNQINGERLAMAIIPITPEVLSLDHKQQRIQKIKVINSQNLLKVFCVLLKFNHRSNTNATIPKTKITIFFSSILRTLYWTALRNL